MGSGGDVSGGERFQLGQYWLSQRRGSQQWCRSWFDPATRQVKRSSLGTGDFEQAKIALANWYVEHAKLKDVEPGDVPVATVLQRYAVYGEGIASRDTVRRAVKLWKSYWKELTVADLTTDALEDFAQWLIESKLTPGYVRRIMGVGKAALNRARNRQEIRTVPFIPLPSDTAVFEHVATVPQLARLLNAIPADSHLWPYALIRLNTGCRGDAAIDLAPPQVDKRHGIVHLNPAGRAQTKKRRPDVPLTNTLREALKTAPKRSAPYVNWHGEPVDSIRTAWRILRADAGLPAWFVPKVLRHTVATELRRRGVSGWEVSALLGHTKGDAAGTTGRYAKYAPEWMQDSREALDALMGDIAKKCGRLRELTSNSQAGTRK